MAIPFTKLEDKELAALERYADQVIKDKEKKREATCRPGQHGLMVVHRDDERRKIVKVCQNCGLEKTYRWTQHDADYINSHPADFAQPGSHWWKKLYGDLTPEQVRERYG